MYRPIFLGSVPVDVAVFLNDFFSGTVLANLERVAPARCTIDAFNRQPIGTDDLSPTPVVQSDRPFLSQFGIKR
jgi:hypothetical protein